MFRTMSHMILIVAVAATFAVTANDAHASRAQVEVEVVPATTPDAFAAQADEVRQSMEPDERYGDISAADRKAVEADITKIAGLLEQVGSAEKLNSNEWVLLVNTQEHANALLTKNDGDRVMRKRPVHIFARRRARRRAKSRTPGVTQRNGRRSFNSTWSFPAIRRGKPADVFPEGWPSALPNDPEMTHRLS